MSSETDGDSIFRPPADRKGGRSFAIYIAGCVILIVGLVYAAILLHVPFHWVAVCAIVLLGLSVLTGARIIRRRYLPERIYEDADADETRFYRR